jgi:hypothetical protein
MPLVDSQYHTKAVQLLLPILFPHYEESGNPELGAGKGRAAALFSCWYEETEYLWVLRYT